MGDRYWVRILVARCDVLRVVALVGEPDETDELTRPGLVDLSFFELGSGAWHMRETFQKDGLPFSMACDAYGDEPTTDVWSVEGETRERYTIGGADALCLQVDEDTGEIDADDLREAADAAEGDFKFRARVLAAMRERAAKAAQP